MTRVKICGLTSLADARLAWEAGADLLGFIFYPPSPRYASPEAVAEICAALRSGMKGRRPLLVGVFVNCPAEEILQTLDRTGLDLAQLSGDEPPAILERLGGRGFKSLRPSSLAEATADAEWYAHLADSQADRPQLLIDTPRRGLYGGTGVAGDWDLVSELSGRYRVLLAGGLTPENVARAVARARPWGVDVASGVERAPGRKDRQKVRALIEQAKCLA